MWWHRWFNQYSSIYHVYLCVVELKRIVSGERHQKTFSEELSQGITMIVEKEGIVAERWHCNGHLCDVVEVLEDRTLKHIVQVQHVELMWRSRGTGGPVTETHRSSSTCRAHVTKQRYWKHVIQVQIHKIMWWSRCARGLWMPTYIFQVQNNCDNRLFVNHWDKLIFCKYKLF